MDDEQNRPSQLSFNGRFKIDFPGSPITSDGGLSLVRELDGRLGLTELIGEHLMDHRALNSRLPLGDLFRQSVYSRLAGYEDVNGAERLSQDPTFRLIGSARIWDRGAAVLSPVPLQRGAPAAERDRVQPGEPVAAAGAAEED